MAVDLRHAGCSDWLKAGFVSSCVWQDAFLSLVRVLKVIGWEYVRKSYSNIEKEQNGLKHAIEIGEKRQKWQVKLAMVLGFNLCTCARAEYGRCADYRVLKRMRSLTCLQKVKVEVCCAKINNVNCRMNVAEHCNGAIYISARQYGRQLPVPVTFLGYCLLKAKCPIMLL